MGAVFSIAFRAAAAFVFAAPIVAGAVRLDAQARPPGEVSSASPEGRAVAFLAAEVPRWRREHPCYSCHNNGDAARALIAAAARGHTVGAAIEDTLAWLRRPAQWDENAQGGGIDDKPLARIQFASALTSAAEEGMIDRSALSTAAAIVARDQREDGSWRLDSSQSVGSPATYGIVLATVSARRTLIAAARPDLAPAIARADRWLRSFEVKNMLDASAMALALADASDETGRAQRSRALDLLANGQASDGGWGLYTTSPSEPFDTAVAVLALAAVGPSVPPSLGFGAARRSAERGGGSSRTSAIARGRQFLIARQLEDGSWPETTRPSGQESYAQRISTAGWATLALLTTQ